MSRPITDYHIGVASQLAGEPTGDESRGSRQSLLTRGRHRQGGTRAGPATGFKTFAGMPVALTTFEEGYGHRPERLPAGRKNTPSVVGGRLEISRVMFYICSQSPRTRTSNGGGT